MVKTFIFYYDWREEFQFFKLYSDTGRAKLCYVQQLSQGMANSTTNFNLKIKLEFSFLDFAEGQKRNN